MHNFDISVLDYLGKIGTGVLVLLSVMYRGNYYEATFFYTREDMLLTISHDLEERVGKITEHPNYTEILITILRKVIPYNDIHDRLDDVDFSKWIQGEMQILSDDEPEIIEEHEIKKIIRRP